jgi:hypothetical protein
LLRRVISESILHGSGNHQACGQRKTARCMKKHFVSGSAHLGKANSSTLAHSTLGRSTAGEKAILPKASVRPPGHPTPTAMLYNFMS